MSTATAADRVFAVSRTQGCRTDTATRPPTAPASAGMVVRYDPPGATAASTTPRVASQPSAPIATGHGPIRRRDNPYQASRIVPTIATTQARYQPGNQGSSMFA